MQYRKQTFTQWWKNIKKKDSETQKDIFGRWLHYACKTAALRGDKDQQRVVYTIATRFKHSEYKKISKDNAYRVFKIINQKQHAHKMQANKIKELEAQLEALQNNTPAPTPNQGTVIRTKKTRKIIAHSGKR